MPSTQSGLEFLHGLFGFSWNAVLLPTNGFLAMTSSGNLLLPWRFVHQWSSMRAVSHCLQERCCKLPSIRAQPWKRRLGGHQKLRNRKGLHVANEAAMPCTRLFSTTFGKIARA